MGEGKSERSDGELHVGIETLLVRAVSASGSQSEVESTSAAQLLDWVCTCDGYVMGAEGCQTKCQHAREALRSLRVRLG